MTETEHPRYAIDPKTLEFLVCPVTKTRLHYARENNELISVVARLAFPIRKGVPLLVPDAARALTDAEYTALRR